MSTDFEKWLSTRPKIIQELGKKYPPGRYKIAENAPYGLTWPGTIVSIMAYNESGTILVMVQPENILPEAIEHSNSILHPQGRDHSEFTDRSIGAHVDPQYLIPYNITE